MRVSQLLGDDGEMSALAQRCDDLDVLDLSYIHATAFTEEAIPHINQFDLRQLSWVYT